MKQAKISWKQGQPFSTEFDDVYFSTAGGIAETEYVFMQQNGLPELWQDKNHFVIAETGFGTGLNFLTTVKHWLATTDPAAKLHFISVEKFPLSKQDLQQALSVYAEFDSLRDELVNAYPPAVSGFHQRWLFSDRVSLLLLQGDVLDMFSQLHAQVDAWYLDGFAPDKNPDMWSPEVFAQIARLSHQGSCFSTYTVAGFVRRGLQAVGFDVSKVKGFGNKREMLSGRMNTARDSTEPKPWFKLAENNTGLKRVAVIGAGIAGITTACALARQGWQVELIDKHEAIAAEASGNPLGVIMPRLGLDDSVDTAFYAQAYLKAIHELNDLTKENKQFSWWQTGVMQLASTARIQKQIANISTTSDLAQVMDADQASLIAGLSIKDKALFYADSGYLAPEHLCQSLLDRHTDKIHLHLNTEIKTLKHSAHEWLLMNAQNELLTTVDAVVLANAAAVQQFQQTAWLDVQCVRGQISYLPVNEVSRALNVPVCYEGYVLPQQNARHIIGATFAPDDCSTDIKLQDHRKNMADINKWFVDLFTDDSSTIEGRAAVRAVSSDRLPVVGPVADVMFYQQAYHDLHKGKSPQVYPAAEYLAGLYVNVAHGARGLTSAFLSADIITAQLNNFPLPVTEKLGHALHPSRFIVRQFKKRPVN